MDHPNPNPHPSEPSDPAPVQTQYIFKDATSETPQGWNTYKLRIDSERGRAYARLATDPERLEFMRRHADEKQPVVFATHYFYEDRERGKEYQVLIGSEEGEEVERLMGDGDEKRGEGAEERLCEYFREHAHGVEELKG